MNISFLPFGCNLERLVKQKRSSFKFVSDEKTDLLIIDENTIPVFESEVGVCFFSSNLSIDFSGFKGLVGTVSCGMSLTDTVSFSSISENKALVSVRREILLPEKIIQISEFISSYNPQLSTYHNLVLSLLTHIEQN